RLYDSVFRLRRRWTGLRSWQLRSINAIGLASQSPEPSPSSATPCSPSSSQVSCASKTPRNSWAKRPKAIMGDVATLPPPLPEPLEAPAWRDPLFDAALDDEYPAPDVYGQTVNIAEALAVDQVAYAQ